MAITQFKYENKCTAAEQELIEVWMHGACTDKEAARVLFKKNGHTLFILFHRIFINFSNKFIVIRSIFIITNKIKN